MGRSNGAVPVILVIYLIVGTAGISYFAADYNFSANRDYQFSEPMKITNESGGLAPHPYLLAYKNYVFAFANVLTWYEEQGLPMCNQTMTVYRSVDCGYTWNESGILSPTPYENFTDPARAEIWNDTLYVVEFFVPNSKDYPCRILLYRSEDFGDSWEGPYNVTPPLWPSDLTMVDLAIWNGTLYVVSGWGPPTNYIQIYFMKSEDGGENWTQPLRLTDTQYCNIWPAIAVWENHVYILWEGVGPQGSTEAEFIKSDDGGNNWSTPIYITPTDGVHSWVEHGMNALIAYQNYVFFVYSDDPGDYPPKTLYFRRSYDYGNTWEDPIPIYQTGENKKFIYDRNIVMDPVTKRLYVSWTDNDTPTGRYVLRFVYSDDFGENWSEPVNVTDYNTEKAGEAMISVYNNTIHAIYVKSRLGNLYYRRSPPFNVPEIPPEWIFIVLFLFVMYFKIKIF